MDDILETATDKVRSTTDGSSSQLVPVAEVTLSDRTINVTWQERNAGVSIPINRRSGGREHVLRTELISNDRIGNDADEVGNRQRKVQHHHK